MIEGKAASLRISWFLSFPILVPVLDRISYDMMT